MSPKALSQRPTPAAHRELELKIEALSDLGSGEWESITTVTEGVYTETAAEAAQFYRIVEE